MRNRGFTLVELLIVIALIGIMLSFASFGFSQFTRKSNIAHQTRLLYGDLMEYRTKALYEKKNWTVKINANTYKIYSSTNTSAAPVSTVTLRYPVTSNNATAIEFNSQGVANLASGKTVCVEEANGAVVDSLVVSQTRVQIGKKQEGMNCEANKINAK